ncbi:MAG: hypothetical protein QOE45_43 [Frankiaceae bacterium]|nr:hypothetical protein [Frankiaceae bacterium]
MTPRRALTVMLVALGLVASAADASGTRALDGQKRYRVRYGASLSQPATAGVQRAGASTDPSQATMPMVADCSAASCDITDLTLTLPKGSTAGWFQVVVTVPQTLNIAVVLYDAKGRTVQSADITHSCCNWSVDCCASSPGGDYRVPLSVARLAKGRYRLVVFDRGGLGTFQADVEFHALPPDRRRT